MSVNRLSSFANNYFFIVFDDSYLKNLWLSLKKINGYYDS